MDEHIEKFNKYLDNTEKTQSEIKTTITEILKKNVRINRKLDDIEEQIGTLQSRVVKITQTELCMVIESN